LTHFRLFRRNSFVAGTLFLAAGLFGQAQNRVNVGAVTKDTGAPASPSELRDTQLFLSTLETQVAAECIKFDDLDYMDRSSVDQVFQELKLSSDAAFDPSSGALRGLLGRLDFLIVIDASSPRIARLRALDIQTGAVRAIAVCRQTRGSAADGDQECVHGFVAQLHPFVTRLFQARQAGAEAAAHALQDAEQAEAQTRELKPDMDAALGRLSAANTFWNEIRGRTPSGKLRPEIETALSQANSDSRSCRESFNSSQPDALSDCIKDLNRNLDLLDSYK
jgi:hypothetical protein